MNCKIIPRKFWEENICFLIVCMGLIDLLSEQIHEIIKWLLLICGVIALICCFLFHNVGKRISIIIILTIFLAIIEVTLSKGILPTQYIWDIGICMPAALCIYLARHVSPRKWLILYITVTLFLLYRLFTVPDHYSVLYSHSRNYISVFIIFLHFMIVLAFRKNGENPPVWIYYMTTTTCIIAIGRGGVLTGVLLFALYVLYDVKTQKKTDNGILKLIILLVGVLTVLIAFILFSDAIIQKFFPRFANAGVAANSAQISVSKRILMWGSYINQIFRSFQDFLLGADPYSIVLRVRYQNDFNLHNSYIMTHAFYGIFGFLGVVIYSSKFAKKLFNDYEFELLMVFICFIFRAVFDHCFPGKLSAIVIWIALFYAIEDRHGSYQGKLKGKYYEHNI